MTTAWSEQTLYHRRCNVWMISILLIFVASYVLKTTLHPEDDCFDEKIEWG